MTLKMLLWLFLLYLLQKKKKSIGADLVAMTKVSNTFARQWAHAVPLLKI